MVHGDADIAMCSYRAGPLNILIFKKLAGLWWAGEVVDHVWIYGSQVAEGSSAFQRRFCCCLFRSGHWRVHDPSGGGELIFPSRVHLNNENTRQRCEQ